MAPRVRVGIVSWNTADLLDRCLDSIGKAAAGLDADVVVVDNDSSDSSADVAARHPGVRVIRNPTNVGYAKAMNQALRAEGRPAADVLIALNPDTVPTPGSLTVLTERLLSEPDVGLVTARLVNPDGTLQHSVYRFPSVAVSLAASLLPAALQRGRLGERFWLEGHASHRSATDIDWAIGAVHAIRAAAVDGDVAYNERWFMYVEDLDLCWRLAARGWRRRLETDVLVMHVGNASGSQAWASGRTRRWLEATYDWYRLVHGRPATRRYAAVNTLGALVRLVPAAGRRLLGRPVAPWQSDLARALPVHLAMFRSAGSPEPTEPGRRPELPGRRRATRTGTGARGKPGR